MAHQRRARQTEKLESVTTAVARLEVLCDEGRGYPTVSPSVDHSVQVGEKWDRAALVLSELTHVLNDLPAGNADLAARVNQVKADVAGGLAQATDRVARTRARVSEMDKFRTDNPDPTRPTNEAVLLAAIASDPRSPEGYLTLGDWYLWNGQPEKAELQYVQAINLLTPADNPKLAPDLQLKLGKFSYLRQVRANVWAYALFSVVACESPSKACEYAELLLMLGYPERSASLFQMAFEADSSQRVRYCLAAAMAATLAGTGVGQDAGRASAARRADFGARPVLAPDPRPKPAPSACGRRFRLPTLASADTGSYRVIDPA